MFFVSHVVQVECLAPVPLSPPSPSSSSSVIVSPLFNITQEDGNTSSFVFTLPIDPQAYVELGKISQQACGSLELSCEWQDPNSMKFRQSGCAVTKSNVEMGSGIIGTECTCSHLTVFAIALRNSKHLAPMCHASEVDYVLLGLYSACSMSVGSAWKTRVLQAPQAIKGVPYSALCIVAGMRLKNSVY